ncbi:MAG TPA: hypothetical protein DC054_05955 [Blastocatellia bacterium]|nr:hypothetical protein [Blastocatellia bacterium]
MSKIKNIQDDPLIQIALPARQWVVLLAILNGTIHDKIAPAVEKLRERGITLDKVNATLGDIDDAQVTALAGPLIIQGVIIKELTAKGIVNPVVNERIGIDVLLDRAEEFNTATKKPD